MSKGIRTRLAKIKSFDLLRKAAERHCKSVTITGQTIQGTITQPTGDGRWGAWFRYDHGSQVCEHDDMATWVPQQLGRFYTAETIRQKASDLGLTCIDGGLTEDGRVLLDVELPEGMVLA